MGQKRLFSFVLSLIGRPKILFLDEPTSAMDTSTRQHFWEIVNQLKQQGVTIVYSSHYIEEVEHTADRILVPHKVSWFGIQRLYAMRSEEQEKHFTLPLTYQSVLEKLDNVTDLGNQAKALSLLLEMLDRSGRFCRNTAAQSKRLKYVTVPSWIVFWNDTRIGE